MSIDDKIEKDIIGLRALLHEVMYQRRDYTVEQKLNEKAFGKYKERFDAIKKEYGENYRAYPQLAVHDQICEHLYNVFERR